MEKKLESTLVGVAGEYLVAGELSLRGYIASITLRNSRGIDIIASNTDASKSVSIQVNTNSDGNKSWILNNKSEKYFSENHYYVFVALGDISERPCYHIVPSKIVAEYTSTSHANWLKGTKRDGSQRKDSSMRKFNDFENKYKEAWHLIDL
ncbi:aspartate ammonia-lyase [bacterium]|nr:aspartate ammonia-lyase [bacterium]